MGRCNPWFEMSEAGSPELQTSKIKLQTSNCRLIDGLYYRKAFKGDTCLDPAGIFLADFADAFAEGVEVDAFGKEVSELNSRISSLSGLFVESR